MSTVNVILVVVPVDSFENALFLRTGLHVYSSIHEFLVPTPMCHFSVCMVVRFFRWRMLVGGNEEYPVPFRSLSLGLRLLDNRGHVGKVGDSLQRTCKILLRSFCSLRQEGVFDGPCRCQEALGKCEGFGMPCVCRCCGRRVHLRECLHIWCWQASRCTSTPVVPPFRRGCADKGVRDSLRRFRIVGLRWYRRLGVRLGS